MFCSVYLLLQIHPKHGVVKRGVTCSSFTSLTLGPPTVLVSIYAGNPINNVIEKSNHFATNLLSDRQLECGMHFAKKLTSDLAYNQFEGIAHEDGVKGEGLCLLSSLLN